MLRRKTLLFMVSTLAVLGTALWLGLRMFSSEPEPPPEIAGIYLPEPKTLADFTLLHQDGRPFTLKDLKGRWTFLYFGFTHCPDMCPTTLASLNDLDRKLAAQGLDREVAYRLISIDPERDTPERLREYTAHFNPKFTGATGTPEDLDRLAGQLYVAYRVPEHHQGEAYSVEHSSVVILIDPQARVQAVFTPPQEPEVMAGDFAKIRQRYRSAG